MFLDRHDLGRRTLLVHIDQQQSDLATSAELAELASSAGLETIGCLSSKRKIPHPKTFVGGGKVDEIASWIAERECDLIVFGDDLSPTQERNLEKALQRRVLGRTGLILEIFARRARTHEGKLQVELAQLDHAASRLVRGWSHLDRQRGGSGRGAGSGSGLGGAGETQLEADQRMLGNRIKQINGRLANVRRQRALNRRGRTRSDTSTISLAGYTNAGKSTLFNRLCNAGVHAEDQLFATLDPTLRNLILPIIGKAVLADTVGFIRALPHGLVDAFRATLEEVSQSDLILHVVDGSASLKEERIHEVNRVLGEIDASEIPQLMVYNKIDLMEEAPRIERGSDGRPTKVWVSGVTGDGGDLLLEAIAERLAEDAIETIITLGPEDGRMRARFFEIGAVVEENICEDGSIEIHLKIQESSLRKIVGHRRDLLRGT
ncbi:MAG TPA: GTPase HflX [Gammaproteobacteria bacterium]|nr:GTPase HflX [Gammaproteobacteria bacterium]